MKKILMIMLGLLCSVGIQAQSAEYSEQVFDSIDSKFRKLKTSFKKHDDDKFFKRVKKFKTRYPSSAIPDYFAAIKYLHNADESTNEREMERNTVRGFTAYKYALRKDKIQQEIIVDTLLRSRFRNSLIRLANVSFSSGKVTKSRNYAKNLIKYFDDTLDIHVLLFPPLVEQQAVVTIKPKTAEKSPTGKLRFQSPNQPASRNGITVFASRHVGAKYKWGGEEADGFDCSGFVLHVYRKFGYEFDHSATEISKIGKRVGRAEMKEGDLLFFGSRESDGAYKISHIAVLYSKEDDNIRVIHATNRGVVIDGLNEGDYWTRKFLFANNIIDSTADDRALYRSN